MSIKQKCNVILLSIDAVRSDRLGCYGYNKGTTKNWDSIAQEGILFENCIAPSCLTPICMSSIVCGAYPNKHTVRDPYCCIKAPTIGEILKKQGYKTAGFVGNGLLGKRHNFDRGFDFFDEPKGDASWGSLYNKEEGVKYYEGHWWVDNMFKWIEENSKSNFFIWGHYYETHEGAEESFLKKGWIKEGVMADLRYMDALIKFMDEKLLGKLLSILEKLNIAKDTILVIMADHGTGIGEHSLKDSTSPWRDGGYPQHYTLYDHDLHVPLVIKGKGIPQGKRIKGMVRSIDVVPTILSILGISINDIGFDGINLCPAIEKGKSEGLVAYAEELFEPRGPGALQALRTEKYKFIRNLSRGIEEFYNLEEDPSEQKNLLPEMKSEEKKKMLRKIRAQLNDFLIKTKGISGTIFSTNEKKEIDDRLRALGYIH